MPSKRQVINQTIATYANVAIDSAYAAGGRETVVEVRNQLIQILGFMGTNINLRLALADEGYSAEQRAEIARNVFAGMNPVLVDLLAYMASERDTDLLRRVYNEYGELIESKLGFSVVDVTTVVDLDDHLRTVINNKAQADLGRDVVLVEHIDPAIKGGIIMSTRNRYVDASVRSQLDRARIVLKEQDGGEM
jgi:F-type H+-transporting ATPase subunit delta